MYQFSIKFEYHYIMTCFSLFSLNKINSKLIEVEKIITSIMYITYIMLRPLNIYY